VATGQVLSAASPAESGFTDEKENWKIGKGFSNTNLMKVTSATSDAQAAVLAYAGNSTAGQWFIPSMNELNELCKYARGQTTGVLTVACNSTGTLKTGTADDLGGFVGYYYWSSSEYAAIGAWDQHFDSGLQGGATKGFTDYVRPVRAFGPTCAAGGTCAVGDRGPGGGIVYYVSAANFTSTGSACNTACKYLEAAPATWQTGVVAHDSTYKWSDDTTVATGQVLSAASPAETGSTNEKVNWKIGRGFSNTSLMKVSGATSAAQAKVLAYAGNSTAGQWFIPSRNELNELCKYARGQTTGDPSVVCNSTGTLKTGTADDLGGFVGSYYWSSSEYNAASAWEQDFDSGPRTNATKGFTDYVRPVRAF
jgi:hypothetical protein